MPVCSASVINAAPMSRIRSGHQRTGQSIAQLPAGHGTAARVSSSPDLGSDARQEMREALRRPAPRRSAANPAAVPAETGGAARRPDQERRVSEWPSGTAGPTGAGWGAGWAADSRSQAAFRRGVAVSQRSTRLRLNPETHENDIPTLPTATAQHSRQRRPDTPANDSRHSRTCPDKATMTGH